MLTILALFIGSVTIFILVPLVIVVLGIQPTDSTSGTRCTPATTVTPIVNRNWTLKPNHDLDHQ